MARAGRRGAVCGYVSHCGVRQVEYSARIGLYPRDDRHCRHLGQRETRREWARERMQVEGWLLRRPAERGNGQLCTHVTHARHRLGNRQLIRIPTNLLLKGLATARRLRFFAFLSRKVASSMPHSHSTSKQNLQYITHMATAWRKRLVQHYSSSALH